MVQQVQHAPVQVAEGLHRAPAVIEDAVGTERMIPGEPQGADQLLHHHGIVKNLDDQGKLCRDDVIELKDIVTGKASFSYIC